MDSTIIIILGYYPTSYTPHLIPPPCPGPLPPKPIGGCSGTIYGC